MLFFGARSVEAAGGNSETSIDCFPSALRRGRSEGAEMEKGREGRGREGRRGDVYIYVTQADIENPTFRNSDVLSGVAKKPVDIFPIIAIV